MILKNISTVIVKSLTKFNDKKARRVLFFQSFMVITVLLVSRRILEPLNENRFSLVLSDQQLVTIIILDKTDRYDFIRLRQIVFIKCGLDPPPFAQLPPSEKTSLTFTSIITRGCSSERGKPGVQKNQDLNLNPVVMYCYPVCYCSVLLSTKLL